MTMHNFNGSLAGEFLKRWREELNFSQQELTSMLGYKNVNFVSMIERSMAKIPADKIVDFSRAYMIPTHVFSALILKSSYPKIWGIVESYNESSSISDKKETNRAFDEWWEKNSVRFGLTKSEWEIILRDRENVKQNRIKAKIKSIEN